MTPPTSTDDKQGTVIDGTARSAEWRKKQLSGGRSRPPGSEGASTDVPATDFDPAAAKDFVSSLMIPAHTLAGETRAEPAAEVPNPNINTLVDGAGQRSTPELEQDRSVNSAQSDELDQWFEEQATSVPRAPAGQALPSGSASLDIQTDAGASVGRARGPGAFGLRVGRRGMNGWERYGSAARRRLLARARVSHLRVLVMTTVTVASIVALAIGVTAGGSPANRSPMSSTRASIFTALPGLLATVTGADRLAPVRRHESRIRQRPRAAHRIQRTPRRRPATHRTASTQVASTGAASSSSYTSPPTSPPDRSPAAAASASSTASGGGSNPSQSSSSPPRTGPSGPISLIGAGTTPSG